LIRILHVLDKISIDSGVSAVVMNYYEKLDHGKLTFDFMINEDTNAATRAYIESKGSKIYLMPRLKVANTFRYIKALKAFYKNHEYQIIHGHVANSAVFYLGLAKKVPYRIIHSHSVKSSDIFWKRIRNWFLTRFIKFTANNYIACSKEAATFLFGKNANATIIHNAVDVERFSFDESARADTRDMLGLKNEHCVIGHIGRFSAVKNHGFLLDAFSEVYSKNTFTRLMLIGEGELYGETVRKAEKLGIKQAILFVGVTEKIGAHLSAMDVFVLPSLFEGLGLAGVEAQASGLKVLASENVPKEIDVTGNVEFLKLDRSIWAKKLLSAPGNGERAKQAEKVKGSRFDIETQVKILCSYYEGL